jgi:S-adenosylmethionine:tRNA ribosyltransferase-isomerase
MHSIPEDFRLESYRYDLPPERIAQHPAEVRENSRLMLLDRASDRTGEFAFTDLPDLLPEGALLVANNTKVLPARLFGARPTGGKVELLLLEPAALLLERAKAEGTRFFTVTECLLKSSKRPKEGEILGFCGGLEAQVLELGPFGRTRVALSWPGSLIRLFEENGRTPLPPYIHREDGDDDRERYQTVYARADKTGAVAAPTAGLHFTEELRGELLRRGFEWAEVTLYVGYGTFSPVRCDDIRDHAMHGEHVEISEDAARAIVRAKSEGRPVLAVGTTTARTLEGVGRQLGEIAPFSGQVNIYIYPGYRFLFVDHLLTNFHLPESSLLIMISALAGRERVLASYQKALQRGFRFFSYGDAMLIL